MANKEDKMIVKSKSCPVKVNSWTVTSARGRIEAIEVLFLTVLWT